MGDYIKAVLKKVGEKPRIINIEDEIAEYEREIGGYIERLELPTDYKVDILYDEEAVLKGLKPNLEIPEENITLHGTLIFVAMNMKTGVYRTPTGAEFDTIFQYIAENCVIDDEDELTESTEREKKLKNQLKDWARYNKKHQKGLPPYYTIKDAGNVEKGNQIFNRMMGNAENISNIGMADGGVGLVNSASSESSCIGEGYVNNLQPVPKDYTIYTNLIERDLKKFGLGDDDLEDLQQTIKTDNPKANYGDGIYKFDWAPKKWNRSKRRSFRIVYAVIVVKKEAHIVEMFAKKDQANLTDQELKNIKKLIKEYKEG